MRAEFLTSDGLVDTVRMLIEDKHPNTGEKLVHVKIYGQRSQANFVMTPEILNFLRTWRPE